MRHATTAPAVGVGTMSAQRITRAVIAAEWGRFCTAYDLPMRGKVGEEGWALDCWQPGGDGASYYAVEHYSAETGPTYPMGERRLTAREMYEALRFARMVRAYMTGGM